MLNTKLIEIRSAKPLGKSVDIKILEENVGLVLPFKDKGVLYGAVLPEPVKLRYSGVEVYSPRRNDYLPEPKILAGIDKLQQDEVIKKIYIRPSTRVLRNSLGYASYPLAQLIIKEITKQQIAGSFGLSWLSFYTGNTAKKVSSLTDLPTEEDIIFHKKTDSSKNKNFVAVGGFWKNKAGILPADFFSIDLFQVITVFVSRLKNPS